MVKKFQTSLRNFRFNRNILKQPLIVDWFRYDLSEDVEDNIAGFNDTDLALFANYTVSNAVNFAGGKNYLLITEGELPVEVELDLVPDNRLKLPEYLIIKPEYEIEKGTAVSSIMAVVLLDEKGNINHNYNLPFGVIGRILYL